MTLLLGIDIGTSSSKGVLVRSDGTLVAQAVREHRTASPRPGWVEHDAGAVWWGEFREIAAELWSGRGSESLAGVAVSGIGPCVLPVGAAGEPLRRAILYGVDTRATEQIAAQRLAFGDDAVLDRCGSPLTTQSVGPKLAWIREHEPSVWERTDRWMMASSFVVERLTGEYVLDHHSASQSTPLYDSRTHEWIDAWCAAIAPGVRFPRLVWPGDVVGTIAASAASSCALPAGTPVLAGTIDAWAEAVSVGVSEPGELMLMYGTTMFLVDVIAERASAAGLWGTVGVIPGTYNLAAGLATSGAITDWLRELSGADFGTLLREAESAGVGAGGVLMLPYFAGERTPLFDPHARGVIAGLTLRHTRGHLYRAALEATAFGVRHNLEVMRESGGDVRRMVAVGGGTRSADTGVGLWPRIVSDVLQQPQDLPRHTIGAAYGDAFLAAVAAGLAAAGDMKEWNPIETTIEPDSSVAGAYDERYGLYRSLYPATVDIAHALAAAE